MADNYLEFSEELSELSEEEQNWLKHQLELVYVFGDDELSEQDEHPDGRSPDWTGCRAFRDMSDYDPDYHEGAGFCFSFNEDERCGRRLWIYSEHYARVEQVAHLVQKFLKQFRPHDCWSLTYATTCSKPRTGEFDGGAVFVTAADIKWQNAYDFIEQERAAFSGESPVSVTRVIVSVSEDGVQDVFSSDPNINVDVVNWDTRGRQPSEAGCVEIADQSGQIRRARVLKPVIHPLAVLSGTDVEKALYKEERPPARSSGPELS